MIRFGAIVRSLMLVLCVAPFTSAQQAQGVLAPIVPIAPAPIEEAPTQGQEDDERETIDGRERHSSSYKHRTPLRELTGNLSATHASHRIQLHVCTRPPIAADPFRNGLGTPYRC